VTAKKVLRIWSNYWLHCLAWAVNNHHSIPYVC